MAKRQLLEGYNTSSSGSSFRTLFSTGSMVVRTAASVVPVRACEGAGLNWSASCGQLPFKTIPISLSLVYDSNSVGTREDTE